MLIPNVSIAVVLIDKEALGTSLDKNGVTFITYIGSTKGK